MKIVLISVTLLFLNVIAVSGQADAGPSLSETLRFIEGKVNGGPMPCTWVLKNSNSERSIEMTTTYENQTLTFRSDQVVSLSQSSKLKLIGSDVATAASEDSDSFETNLKALSPDGVKVETVSQGNERLRNARQPNASVAGTCISVVIKTFNGEKSVQRQSRKVARNFFGKGETRRLNDDTLENEISLKFVDLDTAERVAKAFRHAIALTGGKKESF